MEIPFIETLGVLSWASHRARGRLAVEWESEAQLQGLYGGHRDTTEHGDCSFCMLGPQGK